MSRLVAMDVETFGESIKGGRVLCCGAHGDGISKVFNFDRPQDIEECREILADPTIDKIFHNCMYDTSWLYCDYGMEIKGTIHDTMTRASLINEYEPLALDDCCKRFGIKGKNKTETIEAWYDDWQAKMKVYAKSFKKYGCTENGEIFDPITDKAVKLTDKELAMLIDKSYTKKIWDNVMIIWTNPVGRQKMIAYNLQDCVATYNLFKAQEPYMRDLQRVYDMECRLIPLLIRMKKTGIRFDTKRAEELTVKVEEKRNETERKLIDMYGVTGEMIASSKQLGARLNQMGIYSPVTTKAGAQSWSVEAMARIHHPVVPLIEEWKNYDTILNKFLRGSLQESVINGRIHCTFLPMLRDEGGTVTGRFSCKNPNLQQIPARNKGHGVDFSQDMRSLFLPEEGQMLAADDYSQIEAVLLGHFAQGPQADWFRSRLIAGDDLHKIVMNMTGITYRPIVKTYNYGCIYGMGEKTALEKNYTTFEKLAAEEGISVEQFSHNLYKTYHEKFPVIKDTMNWCQAKAKMLGYIDTMGGRRLHKPKPQYDPATGKMNDYMYKMLNKLIQGTAADILKTALLMAFDAGIYDILTLHLLVHDEQVNSVPFNKAGTEAAIELQHIMGSVYKEQLLVPIKAECELGPNWGYWSNKIYLEMQKGNFDPAFFEADYKETH